MTITFSYAIKKLLSGETLAWEKSDETKAGKILLDKPGQRRLFAFLLSQEANQVTEGAEALFSGLIAAWVADDDPATFAADPDAKPDDTSTWRLTRVEASNFGGLNLFGEAPFDFWVGEENWCVLGQNGSGKTSLVSAVLWALTGRRIREQYGPVKETGAREPVTTQEGKRIGDWPSFAAYPVAAADLVKTVDVWVRLTFTNDAGDIATAYRCLTCPATGAPTVKEEIDSRLETHINLVEATVLMPARISRIGLGKQSQSLYEAVKALTGLDQLGHIADGVSAFDNAGRRFLKYGKDNSIDVYATRFSENIERAKANAAEIGINLPANLELTSKSVSDDLLSASISTSNEAGAHLTFLKAEITPELDIAVASVREKIRTAVNTARGVVTQGVSGITVFSMWTALKEASEDPKYKDMPTAIAASEAKLERALTWHSRQTKDNKFRLKALAAQFYLPPNQHTDLANCPICESALQTAEQKNLAQELAELKADAAEAERKLNDVCRELEHDLVGLVPPGLKRHLDALTHMDPKGAYRDAVRARFCTMAPFSTILLGIAASIGTRVEEQIEALPSFKYPAFTHDQEQPESALELRKRMHSLQRLVGLTIWWQNNRQLFRAAWSEVVGQKQEDGSYPAGSVEAQIVTLESALQKAAPLDALSKLLKTAADAAVAWAPIAAEQARRGAISEALRPLKELRLLVAAETARSIVLLSERMGTILSRIHYQERLSYQRTSLDRKTVTVDGAFEPGMHFDASLVANTSWLRAILWAFVLALREQLVESLGRNPLPLMILDDPQTTFDPRNKRNWAAELARLANLPRVDPAGIQLVLTTHERQFYQIVIDTENLSGEQGMMGGVNNASKVAKIVNGGALDRVVREAIGENDDAKARQYISDVRIYTEDLLKFMLRGQGKRIPNLNLEKLVKEIKGLIAAGTTPFNRRPFMDLINTLTGGGGKPMKYINDLHHKDDETYGVAEAKLVKAFWEDTLRGQIQDAFELYDLFESFYGDPRTFPWARNVVPFPEGHLSEIKSIRLHQTGIAAAAKSDGLAGDGLFTLEEWSTAETVTLPNHEVYQIVASTMDPVASVGDVVVVCNHAPINPRNLVVAAVGERLLARRYNEMEDHPGIAVLTGQSVDPSALVEPVIVARGHKACRKIVGTLFLSKRTPLSDVDPTHEVAPLDKVDAVKRALDGSRLFGVKGRSAEPVALDGQFLITRAPTTERAAVESLDGHSVVAIDDSGARYFKRLRLKGKLVVLESLNPDGLAGCEVLSFDGAFGTPKLVQILEVVGVLFELP